MKKSYLLLLTLPIMLGCSNTSKSNQCPIKNGDLINYSTDIETTSAYSINIDIEQLKQLHASNVKFNLIIGQQPCGSCLKFDPLAANYLKQTQTLIYYLFITPNTLDEAKKYFNENLNIYGGSIATPSIYIFQGDKIISKADYYSFINESTSFDYLCKFFGDSNVYSYTKASSVNASIKNAQEVVDKHSDKDTYDINGLRGIFFLNTDDKENVRYYNDCFLPVALDSNIETIVVNETYMEEEELFKVRAFFGEKTSFTATFNLYYGDKKEVNTYVFENHTDDEITKYLKSKL